jgi:RNA-directed DNA polymerase
VISPLLSNIYLHELDRQWRSLPEARRWQLIRYADDFVVMCPTEADAKAAKAMAEAILTDLKLTMHPEKTRIVRLSEGRGDFTFLGCTLRRVRSRKNGRKFYLNRWPSRRSMQRIRDRIREVCDLGRNSGRDLKEVIADLRPVMQGWAAYFRSGNASRCFAIVERHALTRLRRLIRRRSQRSSRQLTFTEAIRLGLPPLQGTIRYPGGTNAQAG